MRIALDLDGVTVDFDRAWRHHYQRWFGPIVPFSGTWDSFLTDTHFTSEEEFWTWVDAVPRFWEFAQPVPGALGGIWQLLRDGHEIVVVTSRHEKARFQTEEWVRANWPADFPQPAIHLVYKTNKGRVPCQIYIDDNPVVLESLADKPLVIRFKQPWNKGCTAGFGVAGWENVVDFVRTVASGEDFEWVDADAAVSGEELLPISVEEK